MSTPVVSYDITGKREDLQDVLDLLVDNSTPFINMVMDSSMATTNTKHEYYDTQLKGRKDVLTAACDNATTTLTVAGSYNGVNSKLLADAVIRIDDEAIKVTVNSSGTLTVTRAFGGTTAAAHDVNAIVEILGTPKVQGFKPTVDGSEFGARAFNITQIFLDAIIMSGTAQSMVVPGQENQLSTQTQRILRRLKKDLEISAIYGRRFEDTSQAQGNMMGGMDFFIPAANVTNQGGQELSPSMLDSLIKNALEKAGEEDKPDTILCSNIQKLRFNNMKVSRVQAQQQTDQTLNNLIDTYVSEAGPIKVIASNDVRADELFLFRKDKYRLLPLQRRRFGVEPLAKVGDLDQAMVVGEYSLEARNPLISYKLKGLAV